jgi:esterase/lipase superfamily enzyme
MRQAGYYYSALLGTNIDFLWFGDKGRPLVLFPTSGGSHLENEERGLTDALRPAIEAGQVQVVCVNSINNESWGRKDLSYREKLRRHDLYHRFLAEEFAPFVVKHARNRELMVYGASFGAYHAVNFSARHPELVKRCIAFSGFFDLKRVTYGWWEDLCYFHSPEAFVPNMDPDWTRRLGTVEWVVATGDQDSLVEETRRFGKILKQKGVPAIVEIWPDCFGHDWPFWKNHLPRFIA